MQCFLGLSVWLHAGRGRSARVNVAFGGCWQQWWRCALKMCHSTLVWWLNKANRQCRQTRGGKKKAKERQNWGGGKEAETHWREQTGTEKRNTVKHTIWHSYRYPLCNIIGQVHDWSKNYAAWLKNGGIFTKEEQKALQHIALPKEKSEIAWSQGRAVSSGGMSCQALRKTETCSGGCFKQNWWLHTLWAELDSPSVYCMNLKRQLNRILKYGQSCWTALDSTPPKSKPLLNSYISSSGWTNTAIVSPKRKKVSKVHWNNGDSRGIAGDISVR